MSEDRFLRRIKIIDHKTIVIIFLFTEISFADILYEVVYAIRNINFSREEDKEVPWDTLVYDSKDLFEWVVIKSDSFNYSVTSGWAEVMLNNKKKKVYFNRIVNNIFL